MTEQKPQPAKYPPKAWSSPEAMEEALLWLREAIEAMREDRREDTVVPVGKLNDVGIRVALVAEYGLHPTARDWNSFIRLAQKLRIQLNKPCISRIPEEDRPLYAALRTAANSIADSYDALMKNFAERRAKAKMTA